MRIVDDLLELYLVVLFVRIMFTWFPIEPFSPWARIERVLGSVTDPILSRLRRVIPSARIGTMALDLSPIVLFIVLIILIRVL